MKKVITTVALVASVFSIGFSQDAGGTQYLFGGDMAISGFGGLISEVSMVKNKGIYSMGGGGGMLINQSIIIGGYGMGNISDGPLFSYNGTPASFEMGHGGLWLGYIFKPQSVAHFGFSSRFGWGGMELKDANHVELLSDAIFAISPQAEFEVNVLPFMKLNLAVGYKAVLGVNNAYFTDADFMSPYGAFGIYFGWFGDDN